MQFFPCYYHGLWVNHPDLLPFVMKVAGKEPQEDGSYDESDIDAACNACAVTQEYGFDGVFRVIPQLVPKGEQLVSVDPVHYGPEVQAIMDGSVHTYTIPLKHEPELFSECYYKSGGEIVQEMKDALEHLGVEIPEDFPLWKCIGHFEGTTWEDS